jgi:hypothetical protein
LLILRFCALGNHKDWKVLLKLSEELLGDIIQNNSYLLDVGTGRVEDFASCGFYRHTTSEAAWTCDVRVPMEVDMIKNGRTRGGGKSMRKDGRLERRRYSCAAYEIDE